MNRAIIAAALLLVASPAASHEWYPLSCCSERDCEQIKEEEGEKVVERDNGWELPDGTWVAYDDPRVKYKPQPPDGKHHWCRRLYPDENNKRPLLCFFPSVGGS